MTVTQDNIISAEVLHKITKKTQQKWGAELIHKKISIYIKQGLLFRTIDTEQEKDRWIKK